MSRAGRAPGAPPATTGGRGLVARLGVRRGAFALDLALDVAPGQVLALLGPNGAGKSTTLRALAGLTPLDSGRVVLGEATLDDPATGTFVPSERRHVGVVFQDYLLFPHRSAVDNVAFGLRARGLRRRPAAQEARAWTRRMGLADVEHHLPAQLSGGQAQRVALARALATRPAMLLLDEPLAALDAGTRVEVRTELRRHLGRYEGCTVLVTHDPLDALVLADTLVVVDDGRVVQSGPPAEVARAPRTDYVARLVGLNLHRGVAAGSTIRLDAGGTLVTGSPPGDRPVFAAFAPTAVALHARRPDAWAGSAWRSRVTGVEQHGDTVRVSLAGPPPVLADVTPAAVADLDLAAGREVWATVHSADVRAYPVGSPTP